MFKGRFFTFLLLSIFTITNSQGNNRVWPSYSNGFNDGLKCGTELSGIAAGICAVSGFALGALLTAELWHAEKKETDNEKIEQILAMHIFIQDLLYALKHIYKDSKTTKDTMLIKDYVLHNDNLQYFLSENRIDDSYIAADLDQFIMHIRSLFYLNESCSCHGHVSHKREIFRQKQLLLTLINRLYGRFNKDLKKSNHEKISLNPELIEFLLD